MTEVKTKEELVTIIRRTELRRMSFLTELGEAYVPMDDLGVLEEKSKKELASLRNQTMKNTTALAERVLQRRTEAEEIVDEVNQLTATLAQERTASIPPISLKAARSERALAKELYDLKERNQHLEQENKMLQVEFATLNAVLEKLLETIGASMSEEQRTHFTDVALDMARKMSSATT